MVDGFCLHDPTVSIETAAERRIATDFQYQATRDLLDTRNVIGVAVAVVIVEHRSAWHRRLRKRSVVDVHLVPSATGADLAVRNHATAGEARVR